MHKITTLLSVITLLSGTAIAEEKTSEAQLESSAKQWKVAKKRCSGNYSYQVVTSSMTGHRTVTTITVKNNKVAERKFKVFNPGQPEPGHKHAASKDDYVETGRSIGSHSRGAKPKTLDELYTQAAQIIAQKIQEHEKLYLKFDANGLLKCCFTVDMRVMDDTPVMGVQINNLTITGKGGGCG